jgi:hypothetical protein
MKIFNLRIRNMMDRFLKISIIIMVVSSSSIRGLLLQKIRNNNNK